MKQLLLLNIILAALSIPAHADTLTLPVKAVATDVIATYGSFSQTPGGGALGSDTDIEAIISIDPGSAIYGSDSADYSVIDLDFGNTTVVTGATADLVVFSLYSGYDYFFGLEAYDNKDYQTGDTEADHLLGSSYFYSTDIHSTVFSPGILTTSIDLLDGDGIAISDNIELGYIRLFIGGTDLNGSTGGTDAYSNFSLVGAYHTQAAVVPLPLSSVLFGSGLALLSLFRRKNRA